MNILIIDDNKNFREMLKTFFSENKYDVFEASNSEESLFILKNNIIDLILLDLKLGSENGIDILKKIRKNYPIIPLILMTAYATIETAVNAIKLGANDYIQKPVNLDALDIKIKKLIKEHLRIIENLDKEKNEIKIIFNTEIMKNVMKLADNVAKLETTVLIQGDSGTGKELLARYIHSKSKRKDYPFIAINCAAIPSELIESELFGADRGAYTGAVNTRPGKFEIANHGTLFLDEIGDLSLSAQAKVLRAIEDKTIRHLGSNVDIKLDIRLISATNRDLNKLVENKKFRTDLFYRISTYPITIPPLRERKEDIPLLLDYYIELYSGKIGKKPPKVTKNALEELINYDWPGNVREFSNVIERAIIINNSEITSFNLLAPVAGNINLKYRIKMEEAAAIKEALKSSDMNKRKAAKILGISYRSLLYKIKEYNITDKTD